MPIYSATKILCPLALVCFIERNTQINCPKSCECYEAVEERISAICGPNSTRGIPDFSTALHTLALANITFDNQVLLGERMNSIPFSHLSIDRCGGVAQAYDEQIEMIKLRSVRESPSHTSLTITNSHNIYDWRWPAFNFMHAHFQSSRLYAFNLPILRHEFVAKVLGTQIRSLTIINCKLTGLEEQVFQDLLQLRHLRLEYNRLRSIQSSAFNENHSKLWHLGLKGNLIEYISDDLFKRMPALKEIDLSHNRLMNLRWRFFEPVWNSVQFLNLKGNYPLCRTLCWALSVNRYPHPSMLDETDCRLGKSKFAMLYQLDEHSLGCSSESLRYTDRNFTLADPQFL